MSKRLASLLTGWAILTAVVLILPSFTARIVFAGLTILSVVVLMSQVRRSNSPPRSTTEEENRQGSSDAFAVHKLFPATIDTMREGLLVVNRDMQVVASNPAAYRLFGPSPRELEGQRLTELTRNPKIYEVFLDALKGVERNIVKVETVGPERLVFELRVVPLNSNGIGPHGALGVFFDVTRTERLELVRQEFLSNVSHELRTPLTSILAFVETLETGALEDPESSRRFVGIIRKNAARMHALIDDILELTAIEGGNVRIQATEIELMPLVDEVVSSLEGKAQALEIRITNEVSPTVTVYADAHRLERMLTNLIDNGIKFNRPHGEVRIKHEPGVRDKIIVEDDGEGIPSHHLHRLFERFYRVDRARRSSDTAGTGLGLAIVKHLALLHGGEVTVTSELEKGTAFTIHLPHPSS